MITPEIMSPAGDFTALRAALDAGADAVYFGVKDMNMRNTAKNFTEHDFSDITTLCHSYNAKAYLAVNIIVYQHELKRVSNILNYAKNAAVDAVICWDFAVISLARSMCLPVFLSTQASVSNAESILFYYSTCGIRRFVLARECSLNDIAHIRTHLHDTLGKDSAASIQLETFVHGAMCVSVSGRCFLSQFHYGASANRGECYQPCRREYSVSCKDEKKSFTLENNYILSPKDLCTIPFIEKLIDTGIDSFKIEGRNRSPEYVSTVTRVYRTLVDYYCSHSPVDPDAFNALKKASMEDVAKVYNRGFSSGFYMGKPIDEWTDAYGSSSTHLKLYSGYVTKFYRKPSVAEIKIENEEFKCGDTLMIQGPSTGVYTFVAHSIEVEHTKIEQTKRGTPVAVRTEQRVRPNDRVFVVKERVKNGTLKARATLLES